MNLLHALVVGNILHGGEELIKTYSVITIKRRFVVGKISQVKVISIVCSQLELP